MKKTLALLVALMLCLSLSCAAMAEEIPVEEQTIEPDASYIQIDLGENYAYTLLPPDWLVISAEYADQNGELLGAFSNADATQTMLVVYASSETASSYEEIYNQGTENGYVAGLINANGYEYACLNIVADDQVVITATHFVNEEMTDSITMTFTAPAADIDALGTVFNQAIGGLNFYTE